MEQWNTLKNTYEELGLTVHIIEGVPDLPDMVFLCQSILSIYK